MELRKCKGMGPGFPSVVSVKKGSVRSLLYLYLLHLSRDDNAKEDWEPSSNM